MNFIKKLVVLSSAIIMSCGLCAYANEEIDTSTTLYVSAISGLNCRANPMIQDDNIITAFELGKELKVLGEDITGEWCAIVEQDFTGWCYKQYLVENKEDVPVVVTPVTTEETNSNVGKYLGEFTITTYTPDPRENAGTSNNCFGESLYNWIGQTVAVDKNVIPLKSWIYIEGIGKRQARDTGVRGKHIDVLCSKNGGKYTRKVWLLDE